VGTRRRRKGRRRGGKQSRNAKKIERKGRGKHVVEKKLDLGKKEDRGELVELIEELGVPAQEHVKKVWTGGLAGAMTDASTAEGETGGE